MEVFCFVCLETFFHCALMVYESVCELVFSGQKNILKQESGSRVLNQLSMKDSVSKISCSLVTGDI